MKNFLRFILLLTILFSALSFCVSAVNLESDYTKYELISTPERIVVGVDADSLIAYCRSGAVISAYDIFSDEKLFDFEQTWSKVAPFYKDDNAVVIDNAGFVCGFVSKKGKLSGTPEKQFLYSSEFSNGFVCVIDALATENVYSLINRKGEIVAENFFNPEGELKDGSIIIANAGGGYSRVLKNGKILPFECNKNINIYDAVTRYSDVYTGLDGNLYTLDNKLVFENGEFSKISPVSRKWAVGIKEEDSENKTYLINIKNKTKIPLEENTLVSDYACSGGDVSNDKFFVGNMEKSVLTDGQSGKILSGEVVGFTKFYKEISTVIFEENGENIYRFMKNDGTVLDGKYIYATDFAKGFSVAVAQVDGATRIYSVYPDGKQTELFSFEKTNNVITNDKKAVFETPSNEITLLKTSEGNVYIGSLTSSSYIYVSSKGGSGKTIAAVMGALAFIGILIALGDTAKRKKRKHEN